MLQVKNLSIAFNRYTSTLLAREKLEVISSLDLEVKAGEVHAIIGSSGSGKSLLAHAILGILPPNAEVHGDIIYNGEPLSAKRLNKLRGNEIAFIPQSVSFLDPSMKTLAQIAGVKYSEADVRAIIKRYSLDESVLEKYPHELSGGMARRVLVAAAVLGGAKLVIADEPTPGLSENLAREALGHLRELADSGCAVLLITHDIALALNVAGRVSIFYAGLTVETAPRPDFSGDGEKLRHPYSRALWKAMPQNGFVPLAGVQPYACGDKQICPFYSRCACAAPECRAEIPLRPLRGGFVRCVREA
ncbi:MAG: ABC transporter ATP-binding protein [Spirochaetaceae bacterium]|jgi:peptide/nickel transport system ATP-binding protein|nr:ABC transporter ATP-binding protein [Spirochaetaceae bacterium]